MYNADIAIGAGGTTSWERCCMGLPTIIVISASNQELASKSLQISGAAIVLQNNSNLIKKLKKKLCL